MCVAFVGIGCGVSRWSVCAIQKRNENKIRSMAKHNSHTHVLCLGLAKCDGVCGGMGITYVFDQVIERVREVMEIPAVRKFDGKMQRPHVQRSG